ncbi:unnamed protein product, partial [Staurois parvus]
MRKVGALLLVLLHSSVRASPALVWSCTTLYAPVVVLLGFDILTTGLGPGAQEKLHLIYSGCQCNANDSP